MPAKKVTNADLDRRLVVLVTELARLEQDAKSAGHVMVGNINMALSYLRASAK